MKSMDARPSLDAAAFFDEFYPRVFRFIASATGASAGDVDDLVQETLLHAWRNRAQFRGDSSIDTWILAIARNRARMRLRSLERRPSPSLRAIEREAIPEDVLGSEETARAVRQALDSIDPLHAELLVQRYFEGRSIRAIAEARGESEKAVESRLHRAREALRERLSRGEHDEF